MLYITYITYKSGFKTSLTVRGQIMVGSKIGIDHFISGGLALADLSQPAGLSHHLWHKNQ